MKAADLLVRPNLKLRARRQADTKKPRPTRPNEWWGIAMTKVMIDGFGWGLLNGGSTAPFSDLNSGGSKPSEHGHAVLIMRLGNLTIVDWSHNGQCVAWRERNRHSPSLQLNQRDFCIG